VIDENPRSRAAREAAERALVRVVYHYGQRPEFIVIGGLVPELLCAGSEYMHAGTTDIDVQVNLEIACGAVNTERLEHALRNAEFEPDGEHSWRWSTQSGRTRAVVKFELLADLYDVPAESTVNFDKCEQLGAVNLRGTGFATRNFEIKQLTSLVGGERLSVEVNVAGLAGFLLAKCAAVRSRRKPKDWYDIAFVLAHNDVGGPVQAAALVSECFGNELNVMRSSLDDLVANFAEPNAQGSIAYQMQMMIDHPDLDATTLRADAVVNVNAFINALRMPRSEQLS
jgi:hypothetical protein